MKQNKHQHEPLSKSKNLYKKRLDTQGFRIWTLWSAHNQMSDGSVFTPRFDDDTDNEDDWDKKIEFYSCGTW